MRPAALRVVEQHADETEGGMSDVGSLTEACQLMLPPPKM
jgi:hypothetical protein